MHYNPEIRPGTEKWHKKVTVPGSAGKTYQWPNYNDRVYAPGKIYPDMGFQNVVLQPHIPSINLNGSMRHFVFEL